MALDNFANRLSTIFRRRSDSTAEQAFLKAAADMGSERLACYQRFEDYYGGEHKVQLSARAREYLEASGLRFAENFCDVIVDSKADALAVRGFDSDDQGMREFARELWRENRMDATQKRIHRGAVKLGDYFVIVEPREGKLPKICPNHPGQVKAVYDSDEMLYASKHWTTTRPSVSNPDGAAIRRLNVYWPAEIEKWYAPYEDGAWLPYVAEGDEGNVIFWTMDGTPGGEPIGIPVVHFADRPNPHHGCSKLRGVIPQQDALNKSLVDLFWVMDAQGWPQQWMTGVGAGGQVKRHPGSLWEIESDTAKVGQLAAADPTKVVEAIESQIKRMASRSNTPLHQMLAGGQLPSGETLKTSESGYVREGRDSQTEMGNRYEDVVLIAARVTNAFDNSRAVSEDASLDTRWEDVETRNEVDEANVAVLKQTLGVSTDTLLAELGYDPEKEREQRESEIPAVADELLERAQQMQQAPTRSEEAGGGEQPAQKPRNRVAK
ncbi:MAG: phage portal protein [Deltaproteobacteria bacterium]|nr:phage portal protein [Deltaproteobacteria bacterium]